MKKPKNTVAKPAPKTKAEQTTATAVPKPPAEVKKPTAPKAPPKKTQAVTPKPPTVVPDITISQRVGLTAGNVWQYLNENGACPVSTLIRELPEEEKIIQRSIGWLAQEDKITLDTANRVETIALKD